MADNKNLPATSAHKRNNMNTDVDEDDESYKKQHDAKDNAYNDGPLSHLALEWPMPKRAPNRPARSTLVLNLTLDNQTDIR